jgi:two-component system, cell cycle sensor histidine kinase and response regulator CckA
VLHCPISNSCLTIAEYLTGNRLLRSQNVYATVGCTGINDVTIVPRVFQMNDKKSENTRPQSDLPEKQEGSTPFGLHSRPFHALSSRTVQGLIANYPRDLISIHDRSGNYLYASPASEPLLGYTPDELIGRLAYDLFHPDDMDRIHLHHEQSLKDQQTRSIVYRIRKKDGSYTIFETLAQPTDDEELPPDCVLTISRDVTRAERFESDSMFGHSSKTTTRDNEQNDDMGELLAIEFGRLKATSILSGRLTHDINNLTGIILGNVQLMQQPSAETHPGKDRVWTIEQSAKRIAKKASKLAEFCRLDDYTPRPLQLNTLLEETLSIYDRSLPEGVEIVCVLSAAPDYVEADSTQLQQLIIHLAQNALEATEKHGGEIFFTTSTTVRILESDNGTHSEYAQSFVSLTVRDEGHGMDERTLKRSSDPFFSTREDYLGMGLSAAKEIVAKHGGLIEMDSDPGHGTTVRVLLPAKEIVTDSHDDDSVNTATTSGTILVVDDEQGICELLSSLLSTYGYNVLTAENGRKALDIFKQAQGSIDLVLLDILMPEMDGPTAFKHMREIDRQLQVIIISGYDNEGHIAELLSDGAYAFLHKPFDLRAVLNVVHEALEEVSTR